jgi:hypothetical protein
MTHITLTVSVRKSEVESLKKVCAMNDVTLFVHENAFQEIVSVTFETRSAEAVFYMARCLDAMIESEAITQEIKELDARREERRKHDEVIPEDYYISGNEQSPA